MNYIHSVVQTSLLSVPRTFWSSQTETLYLFKNNTLFSPPSSSWQLLLSPLEKCLFKPFAQLDWIFCCSCSCCWVVRVLYVFWLLIPYQIHNLQIFFHSTGCLCSQCLWCTKVFLFLNSSLSIIFFSCLYFWCISEKSLQIQGHEAFLLCFLRRVLEFELLYLTLWQFFASIIVVFIDEWLYGGHWSLPCSSHYVTYQDFHPPSFIEWIAFSLAGLRIVHLI